MNKQASRILWVEDNIGDILLIKEAFKEAGLTHRLGVLNDGMEAINFLFRRGKFAKALRPDLLILDLNLPKKGGREIIEEIKKDSELLKIPLIVLTTSSHEQDVLKDLDSKRCLYLVKPSGFAALVEMAKQIHTFLSTLSE